MHIGHKADVCWGNLSFMFDHDLMIGNCGSFVNTLFSEKKVSQMLWTAKQSVPEERKALRPSV